MNMLRLKAAVGRFFYNERPSPAICAPNSPIMKQYEQEAAEQLEKAGELKRELETVQKTCTVLNELLDQFEDLEFVFKALINENGRRERGVPFEDMRTRHPAKKFFYNEKPNPSMCAPGSPMMQQHEREAIETIEEEGVEAKLGAIQKTFKVFTELLEQADLKSCLNALMLKNKRLCGQIGTEQQAAEEKKETEAA